MSMFFSSVDEADTELPNDIDLDPLIEKSLVQPWWKLRFEEPLETVYQAHIERNKWRQTTIVGGLCLLIFNSGAILDYVLKPEDIWISLFLRVVVGTVPCGLLFWCTRYVRNHRRRDGMVAAGLLLIALVINLLLAIRGGVPMRQAFSMGLLIVVINIVMQLPLMFAFVCNLGVFFLNVAFVMIVSRPNSGEPAMALVFIAVASAITLLASLRLDTALRRLYLVLLRERVRHEAVRRENQALNTYSYTDTLTGIANRRRLDEALQNAWQTARETQKPLALLIIDIDHFKRYNDTYGHPAGDACLAWVARAVASTTRTGLDLAARMGGEEFAVLLIDCEAVGARLVAERIHQAVSSYATALSANQLLEPVTVSIGMSVSVPVAGASVEDFIQAADDALYRAKENGRNQTCGQAEAA
ncbi:diguanylate cyclase (GGDEF)-like protein [Neorhizobium galegae]|uniref:GGDEF domain-containing protein n=1 Tax=Neorhizobium galegae TaxID=399 RepID=UPI001AE5E162|nr:GGDEF domain-containing protein [Neorhizobium galegae]MBP2549239.1 diguanylate cyclase (GGDEF)-like protein [Neorhizobium galegae]